MRELLARATRFFVAGDGLAEIGVQPGCIVALEPPMDFRFVRPLGVPPYEPGSAQPVRLRAVL